MNIIIKSSLRNAKRHIERRPARGQENQGERAVGTESIRVEWADKVRAIAAGGGGLVHQLALEMGLVGAIDRRLHLLKIHRPYHESDHVLNLAHNAVCEGVDLEDIELRHNDEVFLDTLGAERFPEPTRPIPATCAAASTRWIFAC